MGNLIEKPVSGSTGTLPKESFWSNSSTDVGIFQPVFPSIEEEIVHYLGTLYYQGVSNRTEKHVQLQSTENESSTENRINDFREKALDEKLTASFMALIREEDFEFGYSTRSEELLREQLRINKLAARSWLNELFRKNYHDDAILIGILRILGRFDEKEIAPQGPVMALAALSHRSDEIKDLGIRAFESWISKDSLNVLRNTKTETKWLDEYRLKVISDLEAELCPS